MSKIFNFQFSIFNSKKGFTLIELLVVMALLVSVGAIIGAILFSSLRGTGKTNTLTVVRQNGNYAISQIAKTVRNANGFDGVSTTGADGSYTNNCWQQILPTPTPSPTPVQYKYIKITSFDNKQTVLSCDSTTISSNSASLLDTNVVSLTSGSCFFTCTQSSLTGSPIIGMQFTLSQPTGAILSEKTAQITFQTSFVIRNLSR